MSPPSGSLTAVGATQQFTALVKDQHGDTLLGAAVAWSPSNTAVVTVSATGLVTAVANGTAQVTATSGSASQSVSVTVAQVAASLTLVSGDPQTGTVGQALAQPLVAQVKDANANPIQGITVAFTTTAGSVGTASATTAGAQTATASVSSLSGSTLTYHATAAAGAPAAVTKQAGDNQTAVAGAAVTTPPTVVVTDAFGNNKPGAIVTFAVASAGGSITGATATTNSSGVAQVGSWTLGASAATNTLTATVSGAGITGNPATFTAGGVSATYNITIQNVGPTFSPTVQSAFDSAAAKWQRIIYRDIPDFTNFSAAAGDCGSWSPAVGPVNVDDVYIVVKLDSIDGPSGTLGSAGPCYIRSTSRLTIMGTMRFDTADVAALVAAGQLNQVILHEMGHVLGFGTLWTETAFNCLQDPSSSTSHVDTYFNCAKAVAMFDSIGGTTYTGGRKVPVENCGAASPAGCGTGTINSHWREPTLVEELMTGYLNGGVTNPLSRLSAAAMEDLGYGVNYAGADAYVHTFTLRAAGAREADLFLGDDIYRGPIYVVDPAGRVVRVIQPSARR